jgi:hypothetical protein
MPFKSDLVVRYRGGEIWEVIEPLVHEGPYGTFTVPPGTRTDFCSVPRLPLVYSCVGDIGEPAGTLHDWLYQSATVNKDMADRTLYVALRDCGVSPLKASMMYQAVKMFGQPAWDHYRRAK